MSAQQSPIQSPAAHEQQNDVHRNQVPSVARDEDTVMSENDSDHSSSALSAAGSSDGPRININTEYTASMLLESAQEDYERKKDSYYIYLGNYLALSKVDARSDASKNASILSKEALALYKDAEETLKNLREENSPSAPVQDERSRFVPNNLPFLQLKSVLYSSSIYTTLMSDLYLEKPSRELFDSVYDFCQEFVTVLEAHALVLDDSWERLLPSCLTKETRVWFEDNLKGKSMSWKLAEGQLLDYCDTPFRKFVNMGRVWSMKQGPKESVRAFGAKFQKFRRQASLEDGIQLVLCFWWNLRPEVRQACMIPLSSNYGTKMPSKVEEIISLVSTTTFDTSSLLKNDAETSPVSEWKSFAERNGASSSSGAGKGKKRSFSSGDAGKKSKKTWNFKAALKDNICFSCKAPWEKGHSCPERERYLETRVSRMATRSGGAPTSSSGSVAGPSSSPRSLEDNTSALSMMALDCKYNYKDMTIKKDFKNMSTNITFPILVNNSIRTISLLDCGATFSSVDVNF
ncbi:hypothetical protein INT47_001073, partial [Mucor saturninus]